MNLHAIYNLALIYRDGESKTVLWKKELNKDYNKAIEYF